MHIIIAILTGLGGIIWALHSLQNSGVDLNSFNPFYWARRRSWEKKVGSKPLHRIENPMECAAVLVVAMAELTGPVTRELKAEVIQLFCEKFEIDSGAAAELYSSSSYLLKETINVAAEVQKIMFPSKEKYQERHKNILLRMLEQVSDSEGGVSDNQKALLEVVKSELKETSPQSSQWQ